MGKGRERKGGEGRGREGKGRERMSVCMTAQVEWDGMGWNGWLRRERK